MRAGIHGHVDPHGREALNQQQLTAWSADAGKTWNAPQRMYINGKFICGIYPWGMVS
jgi:hypothetical protein